MTEIDIFTESDAESKVGSTEVQHGGAEFVADDIESGMGDIEVIHRPLKRKARTEGKEVKVGAGIFTSTFMSDRSQKIHG